MTRVLVVDDEPQIRRLLRNTLERADYSVVLAVDAREAMRMLAIDKPDAAVDVMLKAFPTVDRNVGLQQIREIDQIIVDPSARDKSLGYLRQDRMQSTASFVDKAFNLNGKVKAADLYTDDFVK